MARLDTDPPDTIHGHRVMVRIPSVVHADDDVVLVDMGPGHYQRFVTGIVAGDDEHPAEWFWGHYHKDLRDATKDLLER